MSLSSFSKFVMPQRGVMTAVLKSDFIYYNPLFTCQRYRVNPRNPKFVLRREDVAPKFRRKLPWVKRQEIPDYQSEVLPAAEVEEKYFEDLSTEINSQISNDKTGRLFAVVYVCGKQFKVTESDLIVVQGYWPPDVGDQLTLEKVLLVGGTDFTLVGRPILSKGLVKVEATIVNKTFAPTKVHFVHMRKKQTKTFNFYRHQNTMIRINTITLHGKIDQKQETKDEIINMY